MPANLYRRPGSPYWWARIQVNGQDQRRSLRTDDRAEARRRLRALIAAAEEQRAGIAPASRHTWQEAVERWMTLTAKELRPATRSRYNTSLIQLDPYFRDHFVDAITGADIQAYAVARMHGGVSSATVRRDLTVASRVLRVAKRAGWIKANPVPEEAGEMTERREPISPIRLRHMAAISRRCPPGFRDMVRFCARTGCRQEEAASLEWPAVDLRAGTVTFARTKTRSPRVIDLKPQVVRDLDRMQRREGYVFLSPGGERYSNVPGRWRVLVRKALPNGPAPRFHDMRHTFAIRALQQGMDIYSLARHLGHSKVSTTEGYLKWLSSTPAQKPAHKTLKKA